MRNEHGVSLIELLVALCIMSLLSVVFLQLLASFVTWTVNLNQILERDENLRLLPLLLGRQLPHAGNRAWSSAGEGISVAGGILSVQSDIDGPAGFPDGSLDSSFEDVQIRLFNDTIQLRSSTGGFQPLVKNASAFEASLGIRLVRVEVTATSQALFRVRRDSLDSIHIVYCLWNLRPELFPPDTEVVP